MQCLNHAIHLLILQCLAICRKLWSLKQMKLLFRSFHLNTTDLSACTSGDWHKKTGPCKWQIIAESGWAFKVILYTKLVVKLVQKIIIYIARIFINIMLCSRKVNNYMSNYARDRNKLPRSLQCLINTISLFANFILYTLFFAKLNYFSRIKKMLK